MIRKSRDREKYGLRRCLSNLWSTGTAGFPDFSTTNEPPSGAERSTGSRAERRNVKEGPLACGDDPGAAAIFYAGPEWTNGNGAP